MSTEEIYNYRKVNERLSTSGQPTERQFQYAAKEGFTTIINLAPFEPGYSLPGEADLVKSLGMDYYNIPVDWTNPTIQDFEAFDSLMNQVSDTKMLIHCVANYRVTAFYSLYAQKHLGWLEDQAEAFRMSIWQGSDYPIWERFIQEVKAQLDQSAATS